MMRALLRLLLACAVLLAADVPAFAQIAVGSPPAVLLVAPQARLSLASNLAVMQSDVAAGTTLYYVPLPGAGVPIGGTMYTLSGQLTFGLNATAHAAGNLYDVFVYLSGGSPTLCTGPAWTNSTARSAALSQITGIYVNSASLTCTLTGSTTTTTIAAGQAIYLGTFGATANGQTAMQFTAAAAAGGSNPCLCLYNAYNRVDVASMEQDSTGTWSYNSGTARPMNNSTSNRIRYVDGLGQSTVIVDALEGVVSGASGTGQPTTGVGLNSTTAFYGTCVEDQPNWNSQYGIRAHCNFPPTVGFNYAQQLERIVNGTSTVQFLSFSVLSGLRIHLAM